LWEPIETKGRRLINELLVLYSIPHNLLKMRNNNTILLCGGSDRDIDVCY
jgi:hypothetical protein